MRDARDPLLEIHDLTVSYETPVGRLTALDSVSLSIAQGEAVGLVGESGSGKSTIARMVLGLRLSSPVGEIELPAIPASAAGPGLRQLLVGSEGTMAIVTQIIVRLVRQPEAIRTLLAIFETVDDASETVAEITARGITPAAVEMMDQLTLQAVEEATRAGYPRDAAAVLLIELEGLTEGVEVQAAQISEVCRKHRRGIHERCRTGPECGGERRRDSASWTWHLGFARPHLRPHGRSGFAARLSTH